MTNKNGSIRITTEIPKESAGRLLDALTDIIRPFSERRGLKADHIRLQREEVAIDIAKRAIVRAEIEGRPIKPVSPKVLVPLLEKGSLEEVDSELIDRWAALLLAAGDADQATSLLSIDILGKISAEEAQTLWAMYQVTGQVDVIEFERASREQVQHRRHDALAGSFELTARALQEYLDAHADFSICTHEDDIVNTNEFGMYVNGVEATLVRLESLGLVWTFFSRLLLTPEGAHERAKVVFVVDAYLTPLGHRFLAACSPAQRGPGIHAEPKGPRS